MKYLVVIERGESGWGAHVPDLPGCVAAADSRDEVASLIREAIEMHLDDMQARGERLPKPSSEGEMVEVHAA
jgi:predicted RNase H-like HicB family nuclease